MVTSDRFNQYTEDVPTITTSDFSYRNPQHPYIRQTPRVGTTMPLVGAGVARGAGGGTTAHQRQKRIGDDFEAQWRQSEERADRIRQQTEGSRPWTGSPDDYNDVVAPPRDGVGISAVTMGPRQVGIHPDGNGGGTGNGNGLSGGAAQTRPSSVGGDYENVAGV
jgi:hypothetical protein